MKKKTSIRMIRCRRFICFWFVRIVYTNYTVKIFSTFFMTFQFKLLLQFFVWETNITGVFLLFFLLHIFYILSLYFITFVFLLKNIKRYRIILYGFELLDICITSSPIEKVYFSELKWINIIVFYFFFDYPNEKYLLICCVLLRLCVLN